MHEAPSSIPTTEGKERQRAVLYCRTMTSCATEQCSESICTSSAIEIEYVLGAAMPLGHRNLQLHYILLSLDRVPRYKPGRAALKLAHLKLMALLQPLPCKSSVTIQFATERRPVCNTQLYTWVLFLLRMLTDSHSLQACALWLCIQVIAPEQQRGTCPRVGDQTIKS